MATSQEAGSVAVDVDPFDPEVTIAGEAKRPTVEREDPRGDDSALDDERRPGAADAPQDGESDEDAERRLEAKRARRRDSRHRKSAAEERSDRLEAELRETRDQFRQFVDHVGPRIQHFEELSVRAQTGGAENAWRAAQAAYLNALSTGATAEQIVALDEVRLEARDNLNNAKQRAQQAQNRPAAPQQQQTQQHQVSRATQDFLSRNSWMGSRDYGEESAIVTALDQSLAKERRDVGSPAYIAELERRAARRLPELFGEDAVNSDQQDDRRPARPTHQGSARASGSAGRTNRVVLPAALIENAKASGLDLADKAVVRALAMDVQKAQQRARR